MERRIAGEAEALKLLKAGRITLEDAPADFRTPEACMAAVEADPHALRLVPDALKTESMCRVAVSGDPQTLRDVPERMLAEDFALLLLRGEQILERRRGRKRSSARFERTCAGILANLSESLREFFAEKARESALAWLGSREHPCICGRVPKAARNEAFNVRVLSQKGWEISSLDRDELTEAVCEAALESWPAALEHVPAAFRTPERCRNAAARDPEALRWVPARLKTPDMCMEAVRRNGMLLKFAPERLLTPELCRLAAESSGWRALACLPEGAPEGLRMEMEKAAAEKALADARKDGWTLKDLPDRLKTAEVCEAAVRQDGRALRWVPEDMKTPELCRLAAGSSWQALEFVPEALKTPELCAPALRNAGADSWSRVAALASVPPYLREASLREAAGEPEPEAETKLLSRRS